MNSNTRLEPLSFAGWPNCYRYSNGRLALIITGDVGPRIISFGLIDGKNLFYTAEKELGHTGGDQFRLYGGHRFWHAPEHPVRTYYPDNQPVEIMDHGDFIRVTAPIETENGVQKEMDIAFLSGNQVRVIHRLINQNRWAIEAAPWALSVMRPGGEGLLVLPPRVPHPQILLPTSKLILWSYTHLNDNRYTLGERVIRIRQDRTASAPQKVGIHTPVGVAAYHWQDLLFVSRMVPDPTAVYPDMNSHLEIYTDADILEVETLGPLTTIAPETAVVHTEIWELHQLPDTTLTDQAMIQIAEQPAAI